VNTKRLGYWLSTAIIVFALVAGGIADLLQPPSVVEGMQHLGYPIYLMTILGIWKVLGGAVLIAPGLPRLKEWAYAGAFFDFSGAAASHQAVGDDIGHIITPLIFAAITLVSWTLRPPSRIAGTAP
jgi:uncharacterized membrane protein YphA (DoxX/SURF4 family)